VAFLHLTQALCNPDHEYMHLLSFLAISWLQPAIKIVLGNTASSTVNSHMTPLCERLMLNTSVNITG
jgi:low temperature requirement protein LtrA